MLHHLVLHNDKIHEASDPVLSPGQTGLLSGWGVFSTLRIVEGRLFAFERHWARLTRDAATLHVPLPGTSEEVRSRLLQLVAANHAQDATMRVVFLRNRGGMWAGPSTGRESDLIALTADSKEWGNGVKLGYVENARHAACGFAGAKSLSWAMNLTWLEEAERNGFDEVLLLNERGEVAECTSANVFIANGNEVLTPPLSSGCLPGVTREVLLEEIRVPGIQIVERPLKPADVERADEIFITSTTRSLLPVIEIEHRKVGRSERVCQALRAAFAENVRRYVAEHAAV